MRRCEVCISWSWFGHFVLHLVKRKVSFPFHLIQYAFCNWSFQYLHKECQWVIIPFYVVYVIYLMFLLFLCVVGNVNLPYEIVYLSYLMGVALSYIFPSIRWWSLWTCGFNTCKCITERSRKKASIGSQARTSEANYQAIWFTEPIAKERGIYLYFPDLRK